MEYQQAVSKGRRPKNAELKPSKPVLGATTEDKESDDQLLGKRRLQSMIGQHYTQTEEEKKQVELVVDNISKLIKPIFCTKQNKLPSQENKLSYIENQHHLEVIELFSAPCRPPVSQLLLADAQTNTTPDKQITTEYRMGLRIYCPLHLSIRVQPLEPNLLPHLKIWRGNLNNEDLAALHTLLTFIGKEILENDELTGKPLINNIVGIIGAVKEDGTKNAHAHVVVRCKHTLSSEVVKSAKNRLDKRFSTLLLTSDFYLTTTLSSTRQLTDIFGSNSVIFTAVDKSTKLEKKLDNMYVRDEHHLAEIQFQVRDLSKNKAREDCYYCSSKDRTSEFRDFAEQFAFSATLVADFEKTPWKSREKYIKWISEQQSSSSKVFLLKVEALVQLRARTLGSWFSNTDQTPTYEIIMLLIKTLQNFTFLPALKVVTTKLISYITSAVEMGLENNDGTSKKMMIVSGTGGCGKSYLASMIARTMSVPNENYLLSEAVRGLCRNENSNWTDVRKFDEYQRKQKNGEEGESSLDNDDPVYRFDVVEADLTRLHSTSTVQPKVVLGLMLSAGAPSELPSYDQYREKKGLPKSAKSLEKYKLFRSQVQRRFEFMTLTKEFQDCCKLYFRSEQFGERPFFLQKLDELAMMEFDQDNYSEFEQAILSIPWEGEFMMEFPSLEPFDWAVRDREISLSKQIEIFFYTIIVFLATKKACQRKNTQNPDALPN
jgi:hypothetical protein